MTDISTQQNHFSLQSPYTTRAGLWAKLVSGLFNRNKVPKLDQSFTSDHLLRDINIARNCEALPRRPFCPYL